MKKTFSDAACASCAVGQFVVGDCLGGPKFGGDFGFRGEHDKPKTSMGVGVASLPSGLLHFEPQKDEGLVQIFVSFPKCFFFPGGSILGFQGVPTCPFRHRFRFTWTIQKICWDLPGINCGELTNSGEIYNHHEFELKQSCS